jgi:hypothetical protein
MGGKPKLTSMVRGIAVAGLVIAAAPAAAAGKTYVACYQRTGEQKPRVRPHRCTALPPDAAFAQGSNLAKLKWTSWGGAVARGTGIEKGFHLPYSHIPVTVRASRVRTCHGARFYTRLKVRSDQGTTTVRFPACAGD